MFPLVYLFVHSFISFNLLSSPLVSLLLSPLLFSPLLSTDTAEPCYLKKKRPEHKEVIYSAGQSPTLSAAPVSDRRLQ